MNSSRTLRNSVLVYLALHIVGVILFLLVISPWLGRQLLHQSQGRMQSVAVLFREHLLQTNPQLEVARLRAQIVPMAEQSGVRLTVVDSAGEVLADSVLGDSQAENHLGRPEIIVALAGGTGTDQRLSRTLLRHMNYLAIPFPGREGEAPRAAIRVAIDQQDINLVNARLQQFIWIFTLSLAAMAAVAMWVFGFRSIQPLGEFSQAAREIAAGNYDSVPLVLNRRDEWRNLSEAFRHMQQELAVRENRLLENSHRLEAVLSSMIEGVIAIDSTGTVMLANEAACEILGLDRNQLVGRKLLELVRIPQLRQAIERTQLQRTFSKVEFTTFGQIRKTVSARVSCLARDPQPGVAVVLHDVTELRQLEGMRRDFVANVSHELRTPLSSIKAYAETLRMGAIQDPENNIRFLQQIEKQADLLNEQIQDLLRLARVESGQAVFEITDIPLREICMDAVKLYQAEAGKRGVELILNEVPADLRARADREGVGTIMNNLIANAIRYSHSGGKVTVSVYAEGDSAVLEVRDTGIGIAAEHQSRVFERFYRVDRARSREAGGTGLGLSIVKHLAQAFGGGVHLESQLGKGSTFRVQIPLSRK